jgi:hypothetical protein
LILVVFGGFAFLLPVALYCLVLAMINRRWHPTLVAGPWDFAGVLFALSGFLILGGPALLTGFNKQWRDMWLLGQMREVSARAADWWDFWIVLWVAYFVTVVGVAGFVLWLRRRSTAIYNVEAQQLDEALNQVLDRLSLPATRTANRIYLHARKDQPAAPDVVLQVDMAPSLRHATLTWGGKDPVLRRQFEAELARQLAELQTPENPVAGWLLTISASLFSVSFVCLLLMVGYTVLLYSK